MAGASVSVWMHTGICDGAVASVTMQWHLWRFIGICGGAVAGICGGAVAGICGGAVAGICGGAVASVASQAHQVPHIRHHGVAVRWQSVAVQQRRVLGLCVDICGGVATSAV